MKYKNRKRKIYNIICLCIIIIGIIAGAVICVSVFIPQNNILETPEELIARYYGYIPEQKYNCMYNILDIEASGNISQEDYIERNSSIYESIEIQNIKLKIKKYDKEQRSILYNISFDTKAGNICFVNRAVFTEGEDGYKLVWDDTMIFPDLDALDKVRVFSIKAERGKIKDRNGYILAGKGIASSVGIVLGKLKNKKQVIKEIAKLLETEPEVIKKKLSAKWVKKDSFVPIKTIPKLKETDLLMPEPDKKVLFERERQEKLLAIPGIMFLDTEIREYPLGKAASHITGYVQSVTAEDLEKHAGEGYTINSVIGRSGVESLFERELKGIDGCRIYITDPDGKEKKELVYKPVEHGKDIQLSIDSGMQEELYRQYENDKSCSVAINQYTGEVLALVSTPSYDSNSFISGMTEKQWASLNNNKDKPLYNRFRQTWCPGSVFKPVIAAAGLQAGKINQTKDYGTEGLSWQKDSSWGSYYITTLHTYKPVILENALIYSDNIYFAKAALEIGAKKLESSLKNIGFNKKIPFEINMPESQYSNSDRIETEIQLADSGYGQGQVLVNPLHMACIYSAFCNNGNIIKPYIIYQKEPEPEYWIPDAFSNKVSEIVLEGLEKVVNSQNGTGYLAHRDDTILAGKTGTAEIKISKDDASGTELGWFVVFTTDKNIKDPVLIISMAEDVKGRGGSSYVVKKSRDIMEKWLEK